VNDTPTTGVAQATPDGELRRQILSQCVAKNEREWWAAGRIEKLEFELNAANDRIQSLIEERDRANRLAEWKWNLRDEFKLLLGTDKIEEGIEVVKELKRHINRLEVAGDAMDKTAEPFVLDTIDEDIPMSDVGEQYEIIYDSPPTAGDHVAMDRARKDWRKAKEAKP